MVKKGVLREWGFRFSLGFEGHFDDYCYAYQNSVILRAKKLKKKREFRLKDAIEKYVGCFLV